jgi:hypothetical protein
MWYKCDKRDLPTQRVRGHEIGSVQLPVLGYLLQTSRVIKKKFTGGVRGAEERKATEQVAWSRNRSIIYCPVCKVLTPTPDLSPSMGLRAMGFPPRHLADRNTPTSANQGTRVWFHLKIWTHPIDCIDCCRHGSEFVVPS